MDTLPWRGGGQPTGGILLSSLLGMTHVAQIENMGKISAQIDFSPHHISIVNCSAYSFCTMRRGYIEQCSYQSKNIILNIDYCGTSSNFVLLTSF